MTETQNSLVGCFLGKVLVDVSNNRRVNQYPESNAEYLASLLPDSVVVKGFNIISAWAMQQSYPKDASTQVQLNVIHPFSRSLNTVVFFLLSLHEV